MSGKMKRGFTLIELLVVISIIALLVSILLPALGRARKQARTTICGTRMHSFGTAFALYGESSNGYFPMLANGQRYWMGALRDIYEDIDEMRLCPEATEPLDLGGKRAGSTFYAWGRGDATIQTDIADGDYGSYGINGWLLSRYPGADPDNEGGYNAWWEMLDCSNRSWIKASNIRHPSDVPFMADSTYHWVFADDDDEEPPTKEGPDPKSIDAITKWIFGIDPAASGGNGGTGYNDMWKVCIYRHNGVVNVLFADGSARKIGLNDLWLLKWHKQFTPTEKEISWMP